MRYLLATILVSILVCSCKKENDPLLGEATALKNDKDWKAETLVNTLGSSSGKIDIKMYGDSETFGLYNLTPVVGKFILDTLSSGLFLVNLGAAYTTTIDGHVLGDTYYSSAPNPENYVIIDSYDSLSGEIKGRFNSYVVIASNTTKFDPLLPDTMRFENGTFEATIKR